jgi:hypothetical protein
MKRGLRVMIYDEVVTFQKIECWCVGSKMIDHVICYNEAGERIIYTKVEFDKNKKA